MLHLMNTYQNASIDFPAVVSARTNLGATVTALNARPSGTKHHQPLRSAGSVMVSGATLLNAVYNQLQPAKNAFDGLAGGYSYEEYGAAARRFMSTAKSLGFQVSRRDTVLIGDSEVITIPNTREGGAQLARLFQLIDSVDGKDLRGTGHAVQNLPSPAMLQKLGIGAEHRELLLGMKAQIASSKLPFAMELLLVVNGVFNSLPVLPTSRRKSNSPGPSLTEQRPHLNGRRLPAIPRAVTHTAFRAHNFDRWFGKGTPTPVVGLTRTHAERTAIPNAGRVSAKFEIFVSVETAQPYARVVATETKARPSQFVADSNGNPIVVFHGTASQFDAFGRADPNGMLGKGFYFTSDKSVAESYARKAVETSSTSRPTPVIYSVVLSLKKPYVINGRQRNILMNSSPKGKAEIVNTLKKQGFDGLVFQNSVGLNNSQTVFMIFEPGQIKSLQNNGRFDSGNPNMHSILPRLLPTGLSTDGKQS